MQAEAEISKILAELGKSAKRGRPSKGTDAWGKHERAKVYAPSVPLYRCLIEGCKCRMLGADCLGHLRRHRILGVTRADVGRYFKMDGSYAQVLAEPYTP